MRVTFSSHDSALTSNPLRRLYSGDDEDDRDQGLPSKKQRKVANAKTAGLKAELKQLLAQPLIARGVSTRYITSGSRSIVDDMILGQRKSVALDLRADELTLEQTTRRCSGSLRVPQARIRSRRPKRSPRGPRRSPRNGVALAPDFCYKDCTTWMNTDCRSTAPRLRDP